MHSWEQRKVSEIAIEKLSNGIMNNQVNDETGLRHINVINMYDSDKIHPEKLTFSGYDEDAVKKCNVELGDIFLTRSSLKPEGIAEANVLLDSGRFVYDDHLIRLKVDKENYDPFFVKLNLSERTFKRQFIVRAKTTAFTTIGQEDIAECSGLFPKREEQEKIGIYFSNLDHLITLHQRKCDETKTLKKYMLQKMFPQNGEKVPEIRFDGFTEDWEQRKFSEGVSEIGDGLHGTPIYCEDGNVYFINGNNLVDGKIVISAETKKVNESQQSIADKSLDDTTILMSINGTIGNLAYYSGERLMLGKSAAYIKVSEFDKRFVYAYLQAPSVQGYFMDSLTGTTIKNLGLKAIREMIMFIPQDVDEQKRIGKFFDYLDHLITLHQRKCNELKEIKKYMLQNMFV